MGVHEELGEAVQTIRELRRKLAALQGEIYGEGPPPIELEPRLRFSPQETYVVTALIAANGRCLCRSILEELLEPSRRLTAEPCEKHLNVVISKIRKKCGDPRRVETILGAGWRISPYDHQHFLRG